MANVTANNWRWCDRSGMLGVGSHYHDATQHRELFLLPVDTGFGPVGAASLQFL